ncbi:hypothetical protein A4A49_32183 [Nicotiana attenuata]|uniref:Uncharacterized protein n=1 Tax=Nicotiana attenuata TaxID=49451 RepID=A0A1J6KSN6_NICAT|nr:hypothetical protein A4A49_32183 [Nicotiana attenuata]
MEHYEVMGSQDDARKGELAETTEVVSFAGLVGDGAALIVSSETSPNAQLPRKSVHPIQTDSKRNGFSCWLTGGNPFLPKLNGSSKEYLGLLFA